MLYLIPFKNRNNLHCNGYFSNHLLKMKKTEGKKLEKLKVFISFAQNYYETYNE